MDWMSSSGKFTLKPKSEKSVNKSGDTVLHASWNNKDLGLFKTIFDNSSDAVVILKENRIEYFNISFPIMFGFGKSDVIVNKNIGDFIPASHRESFLNKLDLFTNGEETSDYFETRGLRKDNWAFEAQVKCYSHSDADGNYIVLTFHDISEKKYINEQVIKLSRVVDQSPSIIVITDIEGRIEYTNPKFTEVTGYFFEDVYGKKMNILKSGHTPVEDYKVMWDTILSGKEWRGGFRNKKKNGELYWDVSSISPLKNELGEITHFLAIKEDVTTKKEMELELKRALDSAEEASRLKSNLLANMSHELRTPLTGIIGFASLLKEEIEIGDQVDMVEKIIKSGKRLLTTLNSILNLSEIESGAFPINISEFKLGAYSRYLLSHFQKVAEEKELSFNIDVLDEDIMIMADENLFKQIMIHLTDNALKFTNRGGVTIEVDSARQDNADDVGIIRIKDTGIGIAREDHPKIFREFRQVSEGIRRNFEGSGLGLAVAKKMTNLMNGDITVESEINVGSVFTITLPGLKTKERNSGVKREIEGRNIYAGNDYKILNDSDEYQSILCIEDNMINSELVSLFLQKYFNVDHAHNFEQAVKKASEKQYSAVLIDVNLGEGPSGIDVVKTLRETGSYSATPMIAITGYALLKDERKLLAQGFDYYLAKPFDKEDLINLLVKALKK